MTNQTPESVIDDSVVEAAYRAFCEARMGRALSDDEHDALRSRLELTWIKPTIAAALRAATEQVATVRNLHHKITRYGNDMYSIHAENYEDDPSSYEDLEPFELCAECYEVEKMICEECGGDAPIGHRSNWPCPTVAALDGAPEPEPIKTLFYAPNVRNGGHTGRPDGFTEKQWHQDAAADTGFSHTLPGRLYIVQCEWCPKAFAAQSKAGAMAMFRRHEDEMSGRLPVEGESKP